MKIGEDTARMEENDLANTAPEWDNEREDWFEQRKVDYLVDDP